RPTCDALALGTPRWSCDGGVRAPRGDDGSVARDTTGATSRQPRSDKSGGPPSSLSRSLRASPVLPNHSAPTRSAMLARPSIKEKDSMNKPMSVVLGLVLFGALSACSTSTPDTGAGTSAIVMGIDPAAAGPNLKKQYIHYNNNLALE